MVNLEGETPALDASPIIDGEISQPYSLQLLNLLSIKIAVHAPQPISRTLPLQFTRRYCISVQAVPLPQLLLVSTKSGLRYTSKYCPGAPGEPFLLICILFLK